MNPKTVSYTHLSRLRILQAGFAAVCQTPDVRIRARRKGLFRRFQVDRNQAARQTLDFPDGILRFNLRETPNLGLDHIEHVQNDHVRTHGTDELRVGDVSQHGLYCADCFTRQYAALAHGNRL